MFKKDAEEHYFGSIINTNRKASAIGSIVGKIGGREYSTFVGNNLAQSELDNNDHGGDDNR